MGLQNELGLNPEEYAKIEDQTTGGSLWEPGVYDVAVDTAFIRKTDKGAKMLEITFLDSEDRKLHYSACTHSGDLKGNKETFGIHDLKHFLQAIGVPDPDVTTADVKFKQDTISALCMTNVQGKKLKVGVIEDQSWGADGTEYLKNGIKAFLTAEGKNGKGEELADELATKISEKPRKVGKRPTGAPAQTAGDTAAMAGSGWGSN